MPETLAACAHQLPDPTTVTLCLFSWSPRVAIVDGVLDPVVNFFSGQVEVRAPKEAVIWARHRSDVPVLVAMLADDFLT